MTPEQFRESPLYSEYVHGGAPSCSHDWRRNQFIGVEGVPWVQFLQCAGCDARAFAYRTRARRRDAIPDTDSVSVSTWPRAAHPRFV